MTVPSRPRSTVVAPMIDLLCVDINVNFELGFWHVSWCDTNTLRVDSVIISSGKGGT